MNVLANNPENNTLVPQQKLKPDEDRKDYLSNYYQENKAKLNTRKKELRRLAKEKIKPVETSEPKFVETKENVETVETDLLVETKKEPEIIVETTRDNVETLKVSRVETFVKLPNVETQKKEIQPASSQKQQIPVKDEAGKVLYEVGEKPIINLIKQNERTKKGEEKETLNYSSHPTTSPASLRLRSSSSQKERRTEERNLRIEAIAFNLSLVHPEPEYKHLYLLRGKGKLRIPARTELAPHTLRRCFATYNTLAGMPLNILQRILGHSKISTTALYIKDSDLSNLDLSLFVRAVANGLLNKDEDNGNPFNYKFVQLEINQDLLDHLCQIVAESFQEAQSLGCVPNHREVKEERLLIEMATAENEETAQELIKEKIVHEIVL
ncbi:13692_t:CDS:2 [Racocetra fulgida]|uniref:13692_t:CDS:1 n=1 Tax=Racocetra fulgida TaxID=60492 RepID=A0A9N9J2H9_9GLOM|nr:13692_t:CDS:2 [Racocetra fulgida]